MLNFRLEHAPSNNMSRNSLLPNVHCPSTKGEDGKFAPDVDVSIYVVCSVTARVDSNAECGGPLTEETVEGIHKHCMIGTGPVNAGGLSTVSGAFHDLDEGCRTVL